MINLEFSINKLREAGLLAQIVHSAAAGIIGGVEKNTNSDIVVFKDAFSIYLEENGKWIARYPGLGQLVQEVSCSNLEEAVIAILNTYGRQSV